MIHPSAVIDSKAELADDVDVGPFCVIGADVKIDSGTVLNSHVVISGDTSIGKNNHIFQFSSIGEIPQDKKYHGENSQLIIGDNNTIRESVTINTGTADDIGYTKIGHNNWIMAYVHIAHDCIVGDHTVFANNASLAGHVIVEDHVILGGFTLINQFCRIGQFAYTGMGSAINKDVPPYFMVNGAPARARSINSTGLKRHQRDAESIEAVKDMFKQLGKHATISDALTYIEQHYGHTEEGRTLLNFCQQDSKKGILR